MMTMVVQHCECTKCHWIVHFKMVNFMLCEVYHSLKTHARKKNSAFNDQICTKKFKFFFQVSFLPFFPFI